MVPRMGNETLRPLGVATGNALSVTRSEDTYEKTPPVGRRQPMTSLPACHNISAAVRKHHQLLRLKLASEAWLEAQGTQCLVPHSGNHGYIRNLRRSPSPTSPCWGECKPISQKRRAPSQLYPAKGVAPGTADGCQWYYPLRPKARAAYPSTYLF